MRNPEAKQTAIPTNQSEQTQGAGIGAGSTVITHNKYGPGKAADVTRQIFNG